MKKRNFGMYIMAIMLAAASFNAPVTVEAYLSPSNSAVLDANSTSSGREQIQFMDDSYLDDYNATLDNTYIIGPGSIPDYLTSPNWAYSPPLRKFVDTLPGLGAANANNLGQYIPVAVPDIVTYPGSDYYVIQLDEYREQPHSDLPGGVNATLRRGYMQTNRGTDTSGGCTDPADGAGTPCTAADNTLLAQTVPHDLGPIIVAQKDRAVRVKFVNNLALGAGGDLFIPVDTTVMGAGQFDVNYDPLTKSSVDGNGDNVTLAGNFTENRALLHLHGGRTPWISDGTPHQWITPKNENTPYPRGVSVQNVPDMPDPGDGANTYYWTNQQSSRMMFYHDHAWGITRLNVYVGEAAGYIIRDDTETALIEGGFLPGTKTDGTTSMGGEIPLVFEDKTFVDPATIEQTDPTWRWGSNPWTGVAGDPMTPILGDLWWPHVYMPAENPDDITGIAPMGRWAYGPYFWPPTNNLFQPIPNPYYAPTVSCDEPFLAPGQLCCTDPNDCCDPNDDTTPGSLGGFCQSSLIPPTPNPSLGAEAFMDTTLINGTAYPVLNVDPKAYRLRILNAAHDRFYNLQMYIADDNATANVAACNNFSAPGYDGFANTCPTNTEVRMVAAGPDATSFAPPGGSVLTKPANWPEDGREGGVPDWSWVGPSWVMIGSEGGFLPQPVVMPNQPTLWNVDVTTFNAGNVNGGSLILGPAERADVVVDFSQYAGKTLILYNDAPAPWPALDPHYDYYTNDPDRTEMGGAPSTPVGFGPNVRTIMQIKVSGTPGVNGTAFDLAALEAEFSPVDSTVTTDGVFRDSQDDIVVAQGDMNPNGDPLLYEAFVHNRPGGTGYKYDAYNMIYGQTFPSTFDYAGVSQIFDTQLEFFDPQGGWHQVEMKKKAIQDEQGETFDEFGRMRANLGLTATNPGAGVVNFVVQTYADPSTEILAQNDLQIWKITHNGVDTHPIHFHLYDVQVLNRVGWDGFVRLPDPTEQGWKDTVRISPLEDTIVAVRPVTPMLPFGIPESYRPLNPATPLGDTTHLSLVDPVTGNPWPQNSPNVNVMENFDWEYVWHCHILSHEENDMMRPVIFQFQENTADAVTLTSVTKGGVLTWVDPTSSADPFSLGSSRNEIGFHIERCDGFCVSSDTFTEVGDALANATTYTDDNITATTTYSYRVVAFNAAGDSTPSNIRTIQTGTLTAPTVAITSPTDGDTVNNPIIIEASASANNNGSISKVEFLVDGVLFATDNTTPFSYSYANTLGGNYALTVIAYDNYGISSAPNTINVTATPAQVSSVSVGTDVTSPQVKGATITFTATATGGVSPKEYQFWLNDPTSGWSIVQAYSTTNTWSWTPGTAGSYNIQIWARGAGSSKGYEAYTSAGFDILPLASVSSVSVGTDVTSPQIQGATITFTATATGGVSPQEYQFWLHDPASGWSIVQAYSTTNTWAWTPGTVGSYNMQIWARGAGSPTKYEAYTSAGFNILPLVSSVSMMTDVTSPQIQGATITFTATATGGVSPQEYQFWLHDPASGWSIMQAYSTTNTWSWTPGTAGSYNMQIWARSAGSSNRYEAYTSAGFDILPLASVSSVSVGTDVTSPQIQGATITFTATATGGVSPQEYQFWLHDPASGWSIVQAYSTTNTWTWTPGTAGSYNMQIWARGAGSPNKYEAYTSTSFTVQ